MPLRVGSPIARVVYDLMAGERIVHLDCAERERATYAVAVIRRLLQARHSSVLCIANSREAASELSARIRSRLLNYGDEDSYALWDPARGSRMVGGQPGGTHSHRVDVVSGAPDAFRSPRHRCGDLALIGWHDKPWRGLRTQDAWPQGQRQIREGIFAYQVLTVGPRQDWHSLAPVMLAPDRPVGAIDPLDLAQPWGPIPLDVMLAGASQ